MTAERRSVTKIPDRPDEGFSWVLPEHGVHLTSLAAAEVATALDVSAEVAQAVTDEHPHAATTYDDDMIVAGCGCGWVSEINRPSGAAGREASSHDFADHLREAVASIEFRGTSVA